MSTLHYVVGMAMYAIGVLGAITGAPSDMQAAAYGFATCNVAMACYYKLDRLAR